MIGRGHRKATVAASASADIVVDIGVAVAAVVALAAVVAVDAAVASSS